MRSDTRTILRFAGTIEAVGVLCSAGVWASGGMSVHGPHNNLGWFALIVALCCVPIGLFFLLLGGGKWFFDRSRTD